MFNTIHKTSEKRHEHQNTTGIKIGSKLPQNDKQVIIAQKDLEKFKSDKTESEKVCSETNKN